MFEQEEIYQLCHKNIGLISVDAKDTVEAVRRSIYQK